MDSGVFISRARRVQRERLWGGGAPRLLMSSWTCWVASVPRDELTAPQFNIGRVVLVREQLPQHVCLLKIILKARLCSNSQPLWLWHELPHARTLSERQLSSVLLSSSMKEND